jgi:hypothetical protein
MGSVQALIASIVDNVVVWVLLHQDCSHSLSANKEFAKGSIMSIEKIAREDQLFLLKKATVPRVDGEHSGHLNERGSDPDGAMALDKLNTEEQVQTQAKVLVPMDGDLNRDGAVSPREAVIQANEGQNQDANLANIHTTMGELARMLAGENDPLLVSPAEYLAKLMNGLDLTQPEAQEFVNKIQNDDDLSLLA